MTGRKGFVLRPPTSAALRRLPEAAASCDRDLDRALSDVGILPPLDLQPIRHVLLKPGVELARTTNEYGHVIIQVCWSTQLAALLHHDGRVQILSTAVA